MDAGTQQVDQPVEAVVEVDRIGMAVTGLEVGEAVEGTAHGACRMYPVVVDQAVGGQRLAQHGHHTFDGGLQLHVTGTGEPVGGRVEARVVTHHGPPGTAHGPYRVIAGQAHGSLGQAVGQDLPAPESQGADHAVVAVDVPVQGGLSDAEALGHPGQGDGVQSLGISQVGRRGHDLIGVQGPAAHGPILVLGTLTFQLEGDATSITSPPLTRRRARHPR